MTHSSNSSISNHASRPLHDRLDHFSSTLAYPILLRILEPLLPSFNLLAPSSPHVINQPRNAAISPPANYPLSFGRDVICHIHSLSFFVSPLSSFISSLPELLSTLPGPRWPAFFHHSSTSGLVSSLSFFLSRICTCLPQPFAAFLSSSPSLSIFSLASNHYCPAYIYLHIPSTSTGFYNHASSCILARATSNTIPVLESFPRLCWLDYGARIEETFWLLSN